jgi:hypothetical protein
LSITAEQLAAWRAGDWRDFVNTCCILRRPDGTIGPLQLSDRQASWMDAIAAKKPDGSPRYSTISLVQPKRSGKTTVAGAASLYVASTDEDRLNIHLSNSRESAEDLSFRQVREFLRHGPLGGAADVQRGRILFPALGSEIRAVPCSTLTTAGLTCSGLLVSDELWAAVDTEPFDLLMKQRTLQAQALVVSQASGLESRVYELHELAQKGTAAHLWHDYITPEELDECGSPNPYMTPAKLAEWRAETPVKAQWDHWFRNVWAEGAGEYLDPEDLQAAIISAALPTTRRELEALLGAEVSECSFASGLDRAMPGTTTGDESWFVTAARTPADRVLVVQAEHCETGAKTEVKAAWDFAARLIGWWPWLQLEVYQSKDLADEWGPDWCEAVTPSAPRQHAAFSTVARLFVERRIGIPEGAEVLLQQLGTFGIDTSTQPPRYGKKVNRKPDDSVFSLAWAVDGLQVPVPTMDPEQVAAIEREAERELVREYETFMRTEGLGAAKL